MAEETGIAPRKTRTEEAELDITPMIDVTFLLLAFFVVVSKMDPTAAVMLPKATNGNAVPEKNCVILVIKKGAGEEFDIFKGKTTDASQRVQSEDPRDQEAEISDYVESQFSKYPTKTATLIKAEGKIKTGIVERVKRGVFGSDLAKSRGIFIGVEETQ